jgi:hypothetical protein
MVTFLLSSTVWAQSEKDLMVVHQIKAEAFSNSKVMDHLASLTDLYGPRLTGSPEWEQAAQWAMTELKSYGLANVHEEKWGTFGKSWSLESYNVDMLTPRYSHLVAFPLAWSSSSDGVQKGELTYAPLGKEHTYDPKKIHKELEEFKAQWHGKLKGKMLMMSDLKQPKPSTNALFWRYNEAQLTDIGKAPTPVIRAKITSVDEITEPDDPEEAQKYLALLPSLLAEEYFDRYSNAKADVGAFLSEEGVAGVLLADARSHNGSLHAEAAGSFKTNKRLSPPTFVVTEEQYSRMQRLVEKKQPVTVRFELKANISAADVDASNILAEIPGQKKSDEVVMIGAHFDSWHSGTGATDNGAGSAVMIEVMRILKKLNLPLNRTVRLALWSGEEQGTLGSRAYVKTHFADVKTGEVKPENAKFDIYFNLDNGSGKIRGVYLEENDAMRPLFESWLEPFRDMDVTTISERTTSGTDHVSFDQAGLPAFQFIQDPLDYGSLVHHADVDTYSHAIPEDLMQASAVIATLVYDAANREEMAPRKQVVRDGRISDEIGISR